MRGSNDHPVPVLADQGNGKEVLYGIHRDGRIELPQIVVPVTHHALRDKREYLGQDFRRQTMDGTEAVDLFSDMSKHLANCGSYLRKSMRRTVDRLQESQNSHNEVYCRTHCFQD